MRLRLNIEIIEIPCESRARGDQLGCESCAVMFWWVPRLQAAPHTRRCEYLSIDPLSSIATS